MFFSGWSSAIEETITMSLLALVNGVIAVNEPRQFLRHRRALQKEPAG